MKKSERQAIAAILIIAVTGLAAWYLTNPVGMYLLAIDMAFNGYEPAFAPSLALKELPRYQSLQQGYVQRARTLDWFGVQSVWIDVNITALNDQGNVWIYQRFVIDTMAEQKLISQRQYDPAAKTSSISLSLAFYMLINRTDAAPIERTWQGSWNLTLPN